MERDKSNGDRFLGPLDVPPPAVPDALKVQTVKAVGGDTGPWATLRSLPSRLRLGIAAVVLAVVAIGVALTMLRADFASYPTSRMFYSLLLLAAAAMVGVAIALRPLGQPPIGPLRRALVWAALLLGPMILALLPDAHTHTSFHLHWSFSVWDSAWRCLLFGTVTGAPLLLAVWMLDRTGFRLGPPLLLVALAAVGAGNLMLQLHCPITDPLHLMLGHALVLAPFLLFWILIRRIIRARPKNNL